MIIFGPYTNYHDHTIVIGYRSRIPGGILVCVYRVMNGLRYAHSLCGPGRLFETLDQCKIDLDRCLYNRYSDCILIDDEDRLEKMKLLL